ncbi:MAG: DNA polymerase-3 subunit gamma/tau [Paraglaciecola sp.]|jgi:DNA polymerase-3 subunit gamma/tau
MSYQVLARKWRPNKFSELVGQEHVVTAISNALNNNRLHHAYLFSGTRGVGKTTIARIFSKSLNCEQGLGANPCGQCSTCKEIEQGNFIDLLEIDAASRTKVEDTRELLDNVQYKPSRGRYKVYLIDEVHMLSKHSFNALLKTLEEPPPHVKFLLATTDPQKLPVTILSRCLQFNLKALSRNQISQQLQYIFDQEGIKSEAEALAQLARAAQGSMRDALSLSDQAIAQGNGLVSLQIVTDMLGLMDKNQVLKLLNALLQKDAKGAMEQVEHMSFQAPDYAQVLAEIMSLLHQIALTQFVPDACKLETISARAIYQLAKTVAPEQIQLLYQIALQGKKDIAFAADGRIGLEMTMLRMLAFSPNSGSLSIDELIQKTPVGRALEFPSLGIKPPVDHVAVQVTVEQEDDRAEVPRPEVESSEAEQIGPENVEPIPSASLDGEIDSSERQSEQELITQQQDIMQEAEQFYSASTERSNETQGDFAQQQAYFDGVQPSQANEEQQAARVTRRPSTTESLLALKQKLQDSQAEKEEQTSQVKKSETSPDERWMPGKGKIADNVPLAPIQPTEDSAIDVATDRPRGQHVAPPWNTGERQHTSSEVSPQQSSDRRPEPIYPPEPTISLAPSPAFDPTAHLGEGLDCAVDFDVPAFLADGQKIVAAQQLDSWSQLIEQMELTALTKQLALHSIYNKLENKVTLALMDSKQHLNTHSAKEQLQRALSSVLQQDILLEVNLDTPVNTPFAVQQTINQVRQQHAQKVVDTHGSIVLLSDTFSARALEGSIKPR